MIDSVSIGRKLPKGDQQRSLRVRGVYPLDALANM